jgi:hypothetical protein
MAQELPFNRFTVESLPANRVGVYGLFLGNHWIYIGQGDIRTRLLAHLNGDNPCITLNRPSHFVYELTPSAQARERQLILELGPTACNERVG